eukprot:g2070.t1
MVDKELRTKLLNAMVIDAAKLTEEIESLYTGIILDTMMFKQCGFRLGLSRKWVERRFLLTPTRFGYFRGTKQRCIVRSSDIKSCTAVNLDGDSAPTRFGVKITVKASRNFLLAAPNSLMQKRWVEACAKVIKTAYEAEMMINRLHRSNDDNHMSFLNVLGLRAGSGTGNDGYRKYVPRGRLRSNSSAVYSKDKKMWLQFGGSSIIGRKKTQEDRYVIERLVQYSSNDMTLSSSNNKSDENEKDAIFVGVFDGHGGSSAAEFAQKCLRQYIEDHFNPIDQKQSVGKDIAHAIHAGFLDCDRALLDAFRRKRRGTTASRRGFTLPFEVRSGGSTACVGLFYPKESPAGPSVFIANAGDCRCVAGVEVVNENNEVSMKAVALSEDHKPYDHPEERRRIGAASRKGYNKYSSNELGNGRRISESTAKARDHLISEIPKNSSSGFGGPQGRYCAHPWLPIMLGVSRGFGDFPFKSDTTLPLHEQFCIAKPDIKRLPLDGTAKVGGKLKFFVFCCDGVFDVMSNEDVVSYVARQVKESERKNGGKHLSLDEIAKKLCQRAFEKGSCDNLTAAICCL